MCQFNVQTNSEHYGLASLFWSIIFLGEKNFNVTLLLFNVTGQLCVCVCRRLWQRAVCPCWTALPCWPLRLRPASTCCMWATMMSAPLWSRSTATGAAAPRSALNSTGTHGHTHGREGAQKCFNIIPFHWAFLHLLRSHRPVWHFYQWASVVIMADTDINSIIFIEDGWPKKSL